VRNISKVNLKIGELDESPNTRKIRVVRKKDTVEKDRNE
jgi:hypothetical protein